jgi:hypothetical protein
MEWFWWVVIVVGLLIILPDPISMLFGWVLDKWFNEFEEEGADISVERRSEMEKAGELRVLPTREEN